MDEIDWDKEKLKLARIIVKNLKAEFSVVHLSGNLANTISITKYSSESQSGYDINIPAEIYDIPLYRRKGVIVHTGNGSYANEVDLSGGFSGRHKNYVDRCIQESIQEWLSLSRIKAKVE